MNPKIPDLKAEVADLGRRLDSRTAALPDVLCKAAQTSLDLLGLRPSEEGRWSSQFTPLVLLYPSLQAEGLSGLDEKQVRAAGEAHALLLIHAFIEDRILDKQVQPDKATALFGSYALWESNAILFRDLQAHETFRERLDSLLSEYWSAQNARYVRNAGATSWELDPDRIMEIAAGRAALGFVATAALVSKVPGNKELFEVTRLAFNRVVTSLQWLDDIEDWREDLENGDENLVLLLLQQRTGLNAYDHPNTPTRNANVAYKIVNNHIFESAAEFATQLFSEVRITQRQLGCRTLETLIKKRLETIPTLLKKGKSEAQSIFLDALERAEARVDPDISQAVACGNDEPPRSRMGG